MENTLEENIKNFIEEDTFNLYDLRGSWANIEHKNIILPQLNEKSLARQISLIKMIENEISKSKKSTPLGLNPDEWEEVEAFNSVYNQALQRIIDLLSME